MGLNTNKLLSLFKEATRNNDRTRIWITNVDIDWRVSQNEGYADMVIKISGPRVSISLLSKELIKEMQR